MFNFSLVNQHCEMLEFDCFTEDELARSCGMDLHWVQECVSAGVLPIAPGASDACFGAESLLRAQRLVQLETMFGADLQLAAMTVDLIEEVNRLRLRLGQMGGTYE